MLFSIFCASYGVYFAYIRKNANKPWQFDIDRDFQPNVTILVPVHNEEKIVESKLRNLKDVSYPKEKIEVIVTDDASTDATLIEVRSFIKKHPELNIKIVKQNQRGGKAEALNKSLAVSTNNIVIVSDADTFWHPDILRKALPYLSAPIVGGITGWGINRNANQSWVTRAESNYLNFMFTLRLGESKIHSTIRFEGGFCAYKKNAFERFDCESGADDSGTALQIVQNGFRTILVPEATFMTDFPSKLRDKIRIKTRRAHQLATLWIRCLKLLLTGGLVLPKKIAIPEIFISIFNPVLFVALVVITVVTVIIYPPLLVFLVSLLFFMVVIPKTRSYLVEIVLSHLILFHALILNLRRKRIIAWDRSRL